MKKMCAPTFMRVFCVMCSTLLSGILYADNSDVKKNGDRFSIKGLPYELRVSKIENGNLSVINNALIFTAYKGTDFFNDMISGKNHDNAPRVLFEPKGDFIFSARMSGKFAGNYDGGALMVYNDIMSSGKLTFELSRNRPSLWSSVTKGATDDVHHRSFNETSMYLKIARKQNMYFFYSSNDGKQWEILRTFVLDKNDGTKVGLMVQSPETPSFTLHVTDIRYQANTFNDYWQGE